MKKCSTKKQLLSPYIVIIYFIFYHKDHQEHRDFFVHFQMELKSVTFKVLKYDYILKVKNTKIGKQYSVNFMFKINCNTTIKSN